LRCSSSSACLALHLGLRGFALLFRLRRLALFFVALLLFCARCHPEEGRAQGQKMAKGGKAKRAPKKDTKAGKKAGKPAPARDAGTPRAESKGAKILELIGRPKGGQSGRQDGGDGRFRRCYAWGVVGTRTHQLDWFG
jgi:hypothetical protein